MLELDLRSESPAGASCSGRTGGTDRSLGGKAGRDGRVGGHRPAAFGRAPGGSPAGETRSRLLAHSWLRTTPEHRLDGCQPAAQSRPPVCSNWPDDRWPGAHRARVYERCSTRKRNGATDQAGKWCLGLPISQGRDAVTLLVNHMCPIIASANSEHLTSVAPSIKRAKS